MNSNNYCNDFIFWSDEFNEIPKPNENEKIEEENDKEDNTLFRPTHKII